MEKQAVIRPRCKSKEVVKEAFSISDDKRAELERLAEPFKLME